METEGPWLGVVKDKGKGEEGIEEDTREEERERTGGASAVLMNEDDDDGIAMDEGAGDVAWCIGSANEDVRCASDTGGFLPFGGMIAWTKGARVRAYLGEALGTVFKSSYSLIFSGQ